MTQGDQKGGEGGGGERRNGGYMADVYQAGPEGLGDGLHPPADAVGGNRPAPEGRRRLRGN